MKFIGKSHYQDIIIFRSVLLWFNFWSFFHRDYENWNDFKWKLYFLNWEYRKFWVVIHDFNHKYIVSTVFIVFPIDWHHHKKKRSVHFNEMFTWNIETAFNGLHLKLIYEKAYFAYKFLFKQFKIHILSGKSDYKLIAAENGIANIFTNWNEN